MVSAVMETAPRTAVRPPLDSWLHLYRTELTNHCNRLLGSASEAEDAMQETLVRAWHGYERFEGRGHVRFWLRRIATNVCLNMLQRPQRRARPVDVGPGSTWSSTLGAPPADAPWWPQTPICSDPAAVVDARDSVRRAFLASLQHLPPRQRAALILREVLDWTVAEIAELLGATTAATNSALQRARSTLAASNAGIGGSAQPEDDDQRRLLNRYVDAFERYDVTGLTVLLSADANARIGRGRCGTQVVAS